jgi:hypothetical protein
MPRAETGDQRRLSGESVEIKVPTKLSSPTFAHHAWAWAVENIAKALEWTVRAVLPNQANEADFDSTTHAKTISLSGGSKWQIQLSGPFIRSYLDTIKKNTTEAAGLVSITSPVVFFSPVAKAKSLFEKTNEGMDNVHVRAHDSAAILAEEEKDKSMASEVFKKAVLPNFQKQSELQLKAPVDGGGAADEATVIKNLDLDIAKLVRGAKKNTEDITRKYGALHTKRGAFEARVAKYTSQAEI